MNTTYKVYDKIRALAGDWEMYRNGIKWNTVFYMGDIVRGRIEKTNYANQYFTIESLHDDGNIITISKGSNAPANTFYYSRDDGATWTSSNDTTTLVLQPGKKVILKAEATIWGYNPYTNINNSWRIAAGNRFKVYGNLMSLIYGDNFIGQTTLPSSNQGGTFMNLFYNATQLIDASELVLPATTLTNACYESMFNGCSSLVGAPALPATILADQSYFCMFRDCSSLAVAPVIPATTLVTGSCSYMFSGCSNLEYIKCLATTIESNSILYWVYGVAASGKFVKAASMTSWPTGDSGIPSGWTVQDVV